MYCNLNMQFIGISCLFTLKYLLVIHPSILDDYDDKRVIRWIRKFIFRTSLVLVLIDWIFLDSIENSTNFSVIQGNFDKKLNDGTLCSLNSFISFSIFIFAQIQTKIRYSDTSSNKCFILIPWIGCMYQKPSDGIIEKISAFGAFILFVI